ncbi:MAG: hypothetical protein H0U84_08990, partial [Thermoleophilaceae bacterium]|nr:hypothetical protein [Thermoleophilaceae bacterium]
MRPALLLVAALALLTGTAPPPAGAQPAAAPVLVIGDSLEAGTAPLLRAELGAIPLTVDQRDGRASPAGVSALARRLRPEHGTVVFDLGTNDDPGDPGRLAASLSAVRELAGDRCLV